MKPATAIRWQDWWEKERNISHLRTARVFHVAYVEYPIIGKKNGEFILSDPIDPEVHIKFPIQHFDEVENLREYLFEWSEWVYVGPVLGPAVRWAESKLGGPYGLPQFISLRNPLVKLFRYGYSVPFELKDAKEFEVIIRELYISRSDYWHVFAVLTLNDGRYYVYSEHPMRAIDIAFPIEIDNPFIDEIRVDKVKFSEEPVLNEIREGVWGRKRVRQGLITLYTPKYYKHKE